MSSPKSCQNQIAKSNVDCTVLYYWLGGGSPRSPYESEEECGESSRGGDVFLSALAGGRRINFDRIGEEGDSRVRNLNLARLLPSNLYLLLPDQI